MGPSCVAAFVADMAAVAFVKALGRSVEAHAAEWEAAPLGTKIFIFCYKKWFFLLNYAYLKLIFVPLKCENAY